MKVKEMTETVEFPEGVQAEVAGRTVKVKGPKGEVTKDFKAKKVQILKEGNDVTLKAADATRREKMRLFAIRAHLKNMIKGVTEGHVHKLKICSGHFPMNVAVSGDIFTVKNFLGEKKPRTLKIKEGAKVKVEGAEVIVEGPDIEKVGQVAADIEQLTRITNKDIRIFQDGIYLIEKSGKKIE